MDIKTFIKSINKEELFHKYYPLLDYEEFKYSDIWISVAYLDMYGDYCSIENSNSENYDKLGIGYFGDVGPVG